MFRGTIIGFTLLLLTTHSKLLPAQEAPTGQDAAASSEISELRAQIADLEERVAALEAEEDAGDPVEAEKLVEEAPSEIQRQSSIGLEMDFPIGIDGYCPVVLTENKRWQQGEKQYAAVFEARVYLLSSEEAWEAFRENPHRYAPVAKGLDVVALQRGILVEGERAHGVFYGTKMYLFANESNLQAFWSDPDDYTAAHANSR